MSSTPLPFSSVQWNAELASALAETVASISRLDARISVSSVSPAWKARSSWTGYATALRLQRYPLDEIDIISEKCGIRLAGRPLLQTALEPFEAFDSWQSLLSEAAGRHWQEGLPFTFDIPRGWGEAPLLVRAFDLLDMWCREDRSSAPWLAFPVMLRRLKVTELVLPCLVTGDPGQRLALDARPVLLKRLLKHLRRTAEDGLARLDRLEDFRLRAAAVISEEHRPGKLVDLIRVSLMRPSLAARSLAPMLELTVSGAGKLLERATRLGLLIETSGRGSWRSYVTPDIALALGMRSPDRGRPPALPETTQILSDVLQQFDAEMAAIDAELSRLGHPLSLKNPD